MRRAVLACGLLAGFLAAGSCTHAREPVDAREEASRRLVTAALTCVDPGLPRETPEPCAGALAALASDDPDARLTGALVLEALGRRGPPAASALAHALTEHVTDEPLAVTLVSALRTQGAEGDVVVAALRAAAERGSPLVARAARSRLDALQEGSGSLAALLDRTRWRGERWLDDAAFAAGRIGPSAVASLMRLAGDPDEARSARENALRVVERLVDGSPSVLPEIMNLVGEDGVGFVAARVAASLGDEGQASLDRLLAENADDPGFSSAARALASDPAGIDVLARRLASSNPLLQERIVRSLAHAWHVDSPGFARALLDVTEPPRRIDDLEPAFVTTVGCVQPGPAATTFPQLASLMLSRSESAILVLRTALDGPDPSRRARAAWQLLPRVDDASRREIRDALRSGDRDASPTVRLVALLARDQGPPDTSGLPLDGRDSADIRHYEGLAHAAAAALEDTDPLVRHAAAAMLIRAWSLLDAPTEVPAEKLAERSDDPAATRGCLVVLRYMRQPTPESRAAVFAAREDLTGWAKQGLPFELIQLLPAAQRVAVAAANATQPPVAGRAPRPAVAWTPGTLADLPRMLRDGTHPDPLVRAEALAAHDQLAQDRLRWAAWRSLL